MLPNGEASANSLFSVYRNNAKARNINLGLDKDAFLALTKENCHYCGVEPRQIIHNNKMHSEPYIYNGVDRVDSSLGYTLENVVPCCMDCNIGKGVQSVKEFLAWAQRVHDFGNQDGSIVLVQTISEPYGTAPGFQGLFGKCLEVVKSKHYDLDLTKEQFDTLVRTQCRYCGVEPHRHFRPLTGLDPSNRCYKSNRAKRPIIWNGLDRLDSNGGYTLDNVVPCCTECNMAKRTQTVEEFYIWIDRIITFQTYAAGVFGREQPVDFCVDLTASNESVATIPAIINSSNLVFL